MKKSLSILMLAAVAALAAVGSSSAKPAAPVQVDFAKHVVDAKAFVFKGTVSGGVTGGLTSKLVSLDTKQGKVLYITFDWIVKAGAKSFTARTIGTWDQNTGQVAMTGQVVKGYLLGSVVQERGKLVDPKTLSFEGYLRLTPKSAT